MPSFRRKPAERIILGIPQLDARLQLLKTAVANKCARAGLSKGARLAAKLIKSEIPSKEKSARRAIGSSVKMQKSGPNRGFTEAKAGAAVGQKKGKRQQEAEKEKSARKAAKKSGVGISAANIHWYIQGTKERTVKKTGQRAGRMPANPVVKKAMASGKGPVVLAVRVGTMAAIHREARKIAQTIRGPRGH